MPRVDTRAITVASAVTPWSVRHQLLAAWLLATFTGCGSAVVDPGRSSRRIPNAMPPVVTQAPKDAGQAANGPSIPSVPLSDYVRPEPSSKQRYHRVESGETLTAVARRYRVGLQQLKAENGLGTDDTIYPGQYLLIPDAP